MRDKSVLLILDKTSGQVVIGDKAPCPACQKRGVPKKIAALDCKVCREKGEVVKHGQWFRALNLKPEQVELYEAYQERRKVG